MTVKEQMVAKIDQLADVLIEASHDIHEHPELAFEEHHAHDALTAILEREGIDVTRGAFGMETAFDAVVGTEGPTVAVCLEYDALPGVGHACGHNIIATAGLGASLAAAAFAGDGGGRVRILGTPAEERGGGKEVAIRGGALEGVDVAMMIHPADADLLSMDAIAVVEYDVEFHGKAAHAAAFPQLGQNALDAAVLSYVNIAALRQHIEDTDRIHGIFTDGGARPNIVPEHAAMTWMVRSLKREGLEPLAERVKACFEAGAAATGCTCTYDQAFPPYDDVIDNQTMLELYGANVAALGRPASRPGPKRVVGSTDMGNVSKVVPSIHPMIRVAPPGISIHSHDFASHARSSAGDEAVILGAKAMAMTIADLWADPSTVERAKAELAAARS
ncbi:MAG TPA: M20 family metallopeptidase [Acidimicrobiales bacterium]|nr:M20 family metallopeptidase [Acidimicrobiales bacterium]